MIHWKSIHIERFRRLENLRLDDLGTVNLLVGKNNSGKTSVLEALAVMSDPFSPFNWINTAWERELKSARTPVLEVLNWMFPHNGPLHNDYEGSAIVEGVWSTGYPLRIEAKYHEFRELALQSALAGFPDLENEEPSEYAANLHISVKGVASNILNTGRDIDDQITHEFRGGIFHVTEHKLAQLPHQFVSPVSHRTNRQLLTSVDQVLEERLKDDVVRLMQKLAPDVEDIEIRSPQGRTAVVHLYHSGIGHVPLTVEGDGMRRALAFASAAVLAKNGILLIDEVETALHPSALGSIFRFLVQICRDIKVQLFVSTHSLEAVDAMMASVDDCIGDLVAYHLPPRGSSLSAYRLGGKSIRSMRTESGLDLR